VCYFRSFFLLRFGPNKEITQRSLSSLGKTFSTYVQNKKQEQAFALWLSEA
jgi:hypothetical protein